MQRANRTGWRVRLAAVLTVAVLGSARPCVGQAVVEAFSGSPFGVGRMEIDLPEARLPDGLGVAGLSITEKDNRVLYPAATSAAAGRVLREFLGQTERPLGQLIGGFLNGPPRTSLFFLFRGEGPLEITLGTRPPVRVSVRPVAQPAAHRRLLAAWWRVYTAPRGLLEKKPDYPPTVENYLQSMLARRLGLPPPPRRSGGAWQDQFEQQLGLGLDTEKIRVAIEQDRMLGLAGLGQAADRPLPPAIHPPELVVPDPDPNVKIEPLALRVPAECFYVRFGNFTNFLWFQDTLERWGGDIQNLVAQRGVDYGLNDRFQQQICLQQTVLARLFGEAAIADAALVGTDLFLPEGAAMGIFFLARNRLLLGSDIARQRAEAVAQHPGTKEEKIKLGQHVVSFLSSPDGSIRSFYASDGDYHFVTNSKTLARRFLETASGEGALGTSREFRFVRTIMPLSREDTVFVYLSDALFRNMVSPQYRIETKRRLQAASDIELVQMAQLVSATEGQPGDTVEQLVAAGLLPPDFGPRPDGSRVQIGPKSTDDSVRGTRGLFVPVPDVEVAAATPAEVEAYGWFAQYYASKWGRVDPIVAGIRKEAKEGGKREHVTIDLQMGPLEKQRYEFLLGWLGPADQMRLAPIPGDMAAGEIILRRQRLFGGMRDVGLPTEVSEGGLLAALGLLPTGRLGDFLRGYVGWMGDGPGLLDLINRLIVSPVDPQGYSYSRAGIWRRQSDRFTVFSLQQDLLAEVTSQLRFEQAARPAHVRARIADVSQANVVPLANRWMFERSRQTTLGNLRLIHSMSQQLHVPIEDAKEAAEVVLGAGLACSLGGQYVLRKPEAGSQWWPSTAWEAIGSSGGVRTAPPTFTATPFQWFRGLDLEAELLPCRISAHVEVEMQVPGK